MNILIPSSIIVSLAIGSWLVLRRKKNGTLKFGVIFFVFGVILVSAGSLLLLLFNGKDVLLANLLLQDYEENGRLVFIGYCFISTSFLLLIESLFHRKENEEV